MAVKKAMKRRKAKKLPMKVQNMCFADNLGGIAAAGTGTPGFQEYYINAAHIMSMMNRKAYHQVDSKGHVINYGLQLQVFNCVNATSQVHTASQGYPMENAVRAWHFARKERYSDAGFKLSDLGYGARLRFALDKTQSDMNQSTGAYVVGPSGLSDTIADKGEWDWSEVIITPPIDGAGTVSEAELIDSFVLHLCGPHTEEPGSTTNRFSHVGMIQSWAENTRGWAPETSETSIQPENPLAFARLSETSSLALTTEVADEQLQSPPYSNVTDGTGTGVESVFAQLSLQGMIESKFPNPTTNDDIIVAPGGSC